MSTALLVSARQILRGPVTETITAVGPPAASPPDAARLPGLVDGHVAAGRVAA